MTGTQVAVKRMYTRAESAVYLAKSTRELDRLIKSGEIIAKKDGRKTLVDVTELDRYVDCLPSLEPERSA